MGYQWSAYAWVLCVAAVVDAVAFARVWRRRGATGATSLCVVLAGAGWWCLAYALQLAAPTVDGAVFWGAAKYVGTTALPPAWLRLRVAVHRPGPPRATPVRGAVRRTTDRAGAAGSAADARADPVVSGGAGLARAAAAPGRRLLGAFRLHERARGGGERAVADHADPFVPAVLAAERDVARRHRLALRRQRAVEPEPAPVPGPGSHPARCLAGGGGAGPRRAALPAARSRPSGPHPGAQDTAGRRCLSSTRWGGWWTSTLLRRS